MNEWKLKLKVDSTEWLLEDNNPSVRYFTLKNILDKPDNDLEVQAAKAKIMGIGIVPEILEKQKEEEYLQQNHRFYNYKIQGTCLVVNCSS